MKVSGRKVAEHRAALIKTATRLLRERGLDGAGVVDICREAGLTQGALYGQFKSKNGLTAEAVRAAFADGIAGMKELCEREPDAFSAYLDAYLSDVHVTDVGAGCVLAACVSDVRRQDSAIGAAFAHGLSTMVEQLERMLPPCVRPEVARRRALTVISALVGSVALARAVEPADPGLAAEVMAAARDELKC